MWVAIAAAVMATASSVASSINENENLKNQSKIAQANADASSANAGNAARAGQAEAEDARRQSRQRLGEMRASFGANGIDIAGSPLDVLQDTAAEGELTAQRKEEAGQVQASAYRRQADIYSAESKVAKKNMSSAGSIAFKSLMTGGMTFASIYGMGGAGAGTASGAGTVSGRGTMSGAGSVAGAAA